VVVWKVPAFEDVTVPAGTFKAFRVEAWPDSRDPIQKRTYWYAPDLKLVVKEAIEGFGRPYDVGVGRDRIKVTSELVAYSIPAQAAARVMDALRSPASRAEALQELKRVGPAGRPALPAVVEIVLNDPSPAVRVAAADVVRAIGLAVADVRAVVRHSVTTMSSSAAPSRQRSAPSPPTCSPSFAPKRATPTSRSAGVRPWRSADSVGRCRTRCCHR
jgi:hypothetical protein